MPIIAQKVGIPQESNFSQRASELANRNVRGLLQAPNSELAVSIQAKPKLAIVLQTGWAPFQPDLIHPGVNYRGFDPLRAQLSTLALQELEDCRTHALRQTMLSGNTLISLLEQVL